MFRRPVSMSAMALGLALTVGLRAAAQAPASARSAACGPAARDPAAHARCARRARPAAASRRRRPGTAAVPGAPASAGLAGGAGARQGAVRRLVQRLPRRRRARRPARRAEPAPLAAGPRRQGRRADHPGGAERTARSAADAAAAGGRRGDQGDCRLAPRPAGAGHEPGRPAARARDRAEHPRRGRQGGRGVLRDAVRELPLRDRRSPGHRHARAEPDGAAEPLGLRWREQGTRPGQSRRPLRAEAGDRHRHAGLR